ncbi:MiAMP1 family antimicrobial peptide [Actinoallomurus spadix]|uniref:Secreted protein n=1 Tax=Actinoallomurus spadix TaxID=79912 RepID=A0ABP3G2A9_9ACTN|nr:MiAMP1 family antimicrobial peptide [Actinoallomurus spadix]MCO5990432.1 MiAMP1 family antimicrobial peptide [Actinoallomurus spadix]
MRKKTLALAPAVTAGIIALSAAAAQASTIVVYEGDHFSGHSITLSKCGMSNIPARYHGSYKWYATGQSARMYNQPNAEGVVHFVLRSDRNAEQATPFGWRSMFIEC